jgi:hypothetical protein
MRNFADDIQWAHSKLPKLFSFGKNDLIRSYRQFFF